MTSKNVLYLTAEWCESLDALLLPIVRHHVAASGSALDLVVLRRSEDVMESVTQDDSQLTDEVRVNAKQVNDRSSCPKANFNLAVILQMLGDALFAVDHMLRVVAQDDNDAVAHTVLRHSLATLRGDATVAAPAYVRQVFDDLAESFEEKLVTHLEYRVPWQLVDALQRCDALAPSAKPIDAVDLGCGTGLCGRLLRPFVTSITGIDLSPLMIEKTRATGFYDTLHCDDIAPFLQRVPNASLDLVISADVWIYVGALEEIFSLVTAKLNSGKWFAFSTELLAAATEGFRLAASGRFQHTERYIQDLAARFGFVIRVTQPVDVRKESGEPIAGRVYVLQRE
ncbi:hypothetical protein P43SY_002838 [Pythium insidiosum]|uniref:Methyltransferase domain-containing protein n=1 Tax=Pythium insidiosum TaxID=114742 RepID=A0AAD5QER4_PYTIN|nr:hypothetical protein P43SY_002838 [Pythium insidiosum]